MVIDLIEVLYIYFKDEGDKNIFQVLEDPEVIDLLDKTSNLINKKLDVLENDPQQELENILFSIIDKEIEKNGAVIDNDDDNSYIIPIIKKGLGDKDIDIFKGYDLNYLLSRVYKKFNIVSLDKYLIVFKNESDMGKYLSNYYKFL